MSNANQPPGKPPSGPAQTMFGYQAPVPPSKRPEGGQPPGAQPSPGSDQDEAYANTMASVPPGQLLQSGGTPVKPPGQPYGLPPPGGQGLGQAPGQPYGLPPPGGQGLGQAPGQAPGQPYGAPPPGGQGFGQAPGQAYGAPPPGGQPFGGGQGMPPPGMQPSYPVQNQQALQPYQAMANLAGRLPSSSPGTLFGIPLSTLRDPQLQQKALLIAGIALLASIFIPTSLGPTMFVWDMPGKFRNLVWPILAGAAYLLVAVAPQDLRRNIPPAVMKWLPFGVAFASIVILNRFFLGMDSTTLWFANVGYPLLVFGLLATMTNPQDQIARILVAVAAGMVLVVWVSFFFDHSLSFANKKPFMIIHDLLQGLVFLVGAACVVFVIRPETVPALRGVDAFKPLVTAILLAWLPVQAVLMMLALLIHWKAGASAITLTLHSLIGIFAYFGIIMLTAPAAYDELKRMLAGGGGPGGGQPYQHAGPPYQQYGQPPPAQLPPQGGFPPPQGGGFPPPQGGGFPPPQGGMPPQGGFPPPQGGGFPPPQGGMPPQGGGFPPPQGGGGGYPPPG